LQARLAQVWFFPLVWVYGLNFTRSRPGASLQEEPAQLFKYKKINDNVTPTIKQMALLFISSLLCSIFFQRLWDSVLNGIP